MAKVTRERHLIQRYQKRDTDWPRLIVRYQVKREGKKLRWLIVEQEVDPRGVDDSAVIEALLEQCDQEAQWAADHPDQVLVATFECD